jgi:methylmalonyl-CoA/ethylmalonyl-CoA epimerase
MLSGFTFHHIGYVTGSIARTSAPYVKAGYNATEVVTDPVQRVKICFLTKGEEPCIELVEPLDEDSSLSKTLKKNGVSPYHICYETDDIDDSFDRLLEMGYTPLFRPVEAAAFDDRQVCYFYRQDIGYIEVVNKCTVNTPPPPLSG